MTTSHIAAGAAVTIPSPDFGPRRSGVLVGYHEAGSAIVRLADGSQVYVPHGLVELA